MTQYGDYQLDIYFGGFEGQLPRYPVDFAALERAAAEVLPPWVYSYVAGGAGDEGTQRGNVEAFSRYGIVPRMLVGADPHPVRVILARGGGMGPVPEGGIQQLGRAPTPLALLACYLVHGHQRKGNAGARNYYEACGGRCPGHPGRGHEPSAHDGRHRPAHAGGPAAGGRAAKHLRRQPKECHEERMPQLDHCGLVMMTNSGGVNRPSVARPARLAMSPQDYQKLGLEKGRMEPWEDAAHTDGSPGTHEWWYIDAEVDGATLAIFMMTKPLAGSDELPLTPNVTVSLKLPDGSAIEKKATIPADEFSASKVECDVRMGRNYFRGDLHSYQVHVEIDDFVADVQLTGTVNAWRPGTGYMFFGENDEEHFATAQPVPLGDARMTVHTKGLDLAGTGPGYIDRGWTNVPMGKLIHDWYWARVQFGEYLVLVWVLTAEKDYGYHEFKQFLVTRAGQIVADVPADGVDITFETSDIHTDSDTGKPVANTLSCNYQAGQTRYTVTFERENDFLHIKFIDLMTGAQLDRARATNNDGADLRFAGTATFVHSEGDEVVYTQQKEAFWELAYFGHAR